MSSAEYAAELEMRLRDAQRCLFAVALATPGGLTIPHHQLMTVDLYEFEVWHDQMNDCHRVRARERQKERT
jgi:hypothetical protein